MTTRSQGDRHRAHGQLQLSTVVSDYTAPLERFFRRRVSVRAEVDDLVQEVFLRLARQDGTETIDNPQAYVFQVAANILRDRGRRRLTHSADEHQSFEDELHGADALSPERVLAARQSVARLKVALLKLPLRTQQVFVLHRFEGLRYGEIANRLGVSLSAVEKHMMKAMKYITRRLEAPWPLR
jgi:RNA polymerase sigma-70 factor (ECF subfamily)